MNFLKEKWDIVGLWLEKNLFEIFIYGGVFMAGAILSYILN